MDGRRRDALAGAPPPRFSVGSRPRRLGATRADRGTKASDREVGIRFLGARDHRVPLRGRGQHEHAVKVIEAFLRLNLAADDFTDLTSHLQQYIPADRSDAANLLTAFALACQQGGHTRAVRVIEIFLRIDEFCYKSGDLAARLRRFLPANRIAAAGLLCAFSNSLAVLGRHEVTVRLLETFLHLDPEAYGCGDLRTRLRRYLPS